MVYGHRGQPGRGSFVGGGVSDQPVRPETQAAIDDARNTLDRILRVTGRITIKNHTGWTDEYINNLPARLIPGILQQIRDREVELPSMAPDPGVRIERHHVFWLDDKGKLMSQEEHDYRFTLEGEFQGEWFAAHDINILEDSPIGVVMRTVLGLEAGDELRSISVLRADGNVDIREWNKRP